MEILYSLNNGCQPKQYYQDGVRITEHLDWILNNSDVVIEGGSSPLGSCLDDNEAASFDGDYYENEGLHPDGHYDYYFHPMLLLFHYFIQLCPQLYTLSENQLP